MAVISGNARPSTAYERIPIATMNAEWKVMLIGDQNFAGPTRGVLRLRNQIVPAEYTMNAGPSPVRSQSRFTCTSGHQPREHVLRDRPLVAA